MEDSDMATAPHGESVRLLLVEDRRQRSAVVARYEHPYLVRVTHWLSAISVTVVILSGLQIFRAFPSFGPKIPQADLVKVPSGLGLGGWLGGALQWHLTFMWPLIAAGVIYVAYQAASGNYRQVLFSRRDIGGVWPMVRHYSLLGPKPESKESYNPLQKLAYTSTILFGVVAVISGLALYKPVQLSPLLWMLGGFRLARIWHFVAMLGFVSFIPGHLIMVALHGWSNFYSMVVGWRTDKMSTHG
jgi:Ni/Fe-hydrogenase b-type cytochrome subunit